VRREDGRAPHGLECLVERRVLVFDQNAHSLECGEGGVALVQVEDGRPEAERRERADAADAEHELLPDTRLAVAAVEPIGERARPCRVLGEVGVEQQQRHRADVEPPHGSLDHLVADLDRHRRGGPCESELGRRVQRVELALLPLRDLLAEVALPVEETDADERDTEI
jgi:hypothetical protein